MKKKVPIAAMGQANVSAASSIRVNTGVFLGLGPIMITARVDAVEKTASRDTGHLFLDCEGYNMVADQMVFEKVGKTEKIIGYYLVFSKHFRTVYKERLPISVPKVKLWT